MSCETETAVTLRHAGQKVTPQRMLILCTVRHASHHVTAGQVLDEVKRSYPFVDASTVYRTLSSAGALAVALLTGACSSSDNNSTSSVAAGASGSKTLNVVTTVAPLTNIVQNIGGNRIDLAGIIPDGVDSHTFEPRPENAKELANAD